MLHIVESTKPLAGVMTDLEQAVARHKFGVPGTHDLSVYEEGGKTMLATIRPTALIGLYGTPELKSVAREVEETMFRIMAEAAG
jgi:uncharacterized protein (DUF302 family)